MINKKNYGTTNPYYGVVAKNGLGVFRTKERLEKTLDYARDARVEVFDARWAAVQSTIQNYNYQLYCHNCNYGYYNKTTMNMGWFYFKSELAGNGGRVYMDEPVKIIKPIEFDNQRGGFYNE